MSRNVKERGPFDTELARAVEEELSRAVFARPSASQFGASDGWRCKECGCTNDRACPGGCSWVEPNLCSACDER